MRIVLVGFMGAGKSTFGRKLANKLDIPFIDSDWEISLNENKSMDQLFKELGETRFRDLETEFINSLALSNTDYVLSTGGGLPCFNNNMETLNKLGTTIYLELPAKAIFKRLENGRDERPLIRNMNDDELLQYIETTLENRENYYTQSKITISGLSLNANAMDDLIKTIYSK